MGAERVVSVHLSADWVKPTGPRHVFDIIGQCFSIAQDKMCELWRSDSDLVVEPEIGDFSYDDFARASDIVSAGEAAARAILPKLREWFPLDALEPAKAQAAAIVVECNASQPAAS
jgi:hypothetical protein